MAGNGNHRPLLSVCAAELFGSDRAVVIRHRGEEYLLTCAPGDDGRLVLLGPEVRPAPPRSGPGGRARR